MYILGSLYEIFVPSSSSPSEKENSLVDCIKGSAAINGSLLSEEGNHIPYIILQLTTVQFKLANIESLADAKLEALHAKAMHILNVQVNVFLKEKIKGCEEIVRNKKLWTLKNIRKSGADLMLLEKAAQSLPATEENKISITKLSILSKQIQGCIERIAFLDFKEHLEKLSDQEELLRVDSLRQIQWIAGTL